MAAETGHAASRVYHAQDGSLHLNGASVFDASEVDITTGLSLATGVTAGTVAASKAVVADANKDVGGFRNLSATQITAQKAVTAYAADGALTISDGVHALSKAGVGVMTLAAPSAGQAGTVMIITAQSANAHTVTLTEGFNNAGAAGDVATFGGAIGDTMMIVAVNAHWNVLSLRNVTLG